MPTTHKKARMAVAASVLVLGGAGGAGTAAAQPTANGPAQRSDCDTAASIRPVPVKAVPPIPAGDITVGASCTNFSG
ncbi:MULTISPECIES: hypothetical protein [Streptomyces]|nr:MULTISPECIES: hypothetical protein [Streptomyces]